MSSSRQLLLATTSIVRPTRPCSTTLIPSSFTSTSRQTHSHTYDRSSTLPLSRRNAHALASHSRYNERLPPPPTPSQAPLKKKTLDSYAPRDDETIQEEIEKEAFPTWETRDQLTGTNNGDRSYIDVGETVYADDLDGDVEMDWEDWPKERKETVRTGTISVERGNKGKGKAKEDAKELMVPLATLAKIEATKRNQGISKASPPTPARTLESPFTQRPRRHPAKRLLLQRCERLPLNTVLPYLVPAPLPPCPVHPSPQPHEVPLDSRSDWRLSSPLRRYLRPSPPSLYSRSENDTKSQGHNRLLGVGLETSRIARSYKSRDVEGAEAWGWKVKVKDSEKGSWTSADQYRKRLDRLLSLSRKSDEDNYRLNLARQGTPSERELDGKTLCRAIGTWLTDYSRAEEIQSLRKSKQDQKVSPGMTSSGAKAVASFRSEDGRQLTEDLWDFAAANTIVRITRARKDDFDLNGPQPSPSATSQLDEWYVQGTVLEARDTRIVVAFEESDMWPMNEESVYQIDLGLDESSYHLQEQAINNLYFDPSRQRLRNASHVQEAQEAALDGATPTLREWTLQGTDLRELIVPKIEENSLQSIKPSQPVDEDLLDDSPAAELAHLPSPESLLNPDIMQPRNSSSSTLHPSDLITQNQLINSWAQRYMRDDPMILPGDPELGLNPSQTKAVAMAMGEKLSLIQGPPGTGKSQTIVSLIALLKLHFRIPQPILLAAPTHVSTDHLLSLLVRRGLNPLRCGKPSKVSPEIEKWTIEKRQEQHPLWVRLEETRLECETLRDELKRSKDQTAGITEPGERKVAEARDFELEQRYRKLWRKYIMLEQRLYSSLLATADVFCATALGSGASKVLNMIDFPIVFLDEAAMCTEPVTLVPLMKGAQQVTLIGDHKQLPAVVSSQEAKKERLQISLFERLLVAQTVKSVLLDTQYRMRPAISAFPNLSFYRSALQDAKSVSARPPPPRSRFFTTPLDSSTGSLSPQPLTPLPVAFVSHSGSESVNRRSTLNRVEVDVIVDIVGDLLDRNPALDARDIGIISPYFAQMQLLQNTFESGWAAKRLAKVLGRSRASELQGVEINTVDGFQGREKKVIILSTVRSNKGGWIGFLTDKRRLNVALTRAKDALFVVGNKATLRMAAGNEWMETDPDSDPGIWRRFLMWCEQRGLVKDWKQEGGGTGQV